VGHTQCTSVASPTTVKKAKMKRALLPAYAGQLNLSVCADAEQFPDLDILVAGMERSWAHLQLPDPHEPVGEGPLLPAP
jgi:hypothetical protein